MLAAQGGHTESVKTLIEAGASMTSRNTVSIWGWHLSFRLLLFDIHNRLRRLLLY